MPNREKIEVILETEDGEEGEPFELPSKYEVCPRCQGKGTHVNPSIDGHGITAEEWERDWDDESRETYMTGGYDVQCYDCGGQRVILVVDRDAIIERGSLQERAALVEYDRQQESIRECDAESAAERRFGA